MTIPSLILSPLSLDSVKLYHTVKVSAFLTYLVSSRDSKTLAGMSPELFSVLRGAWSDV